MKIHDNSGAGVSELNRAPELNSHAADSRSRGAQRSGGDRVSLSHLSSALSAQQGDSPERSAHLAQLSAAVLGGTYRVDPQVLSGRIINSSLRA